MIREKGCSTYTSLIQAYNTFSASVTLNVDKVTPNGCLVSGPIDFQIGMEAAGNHHYIIIPFSDEMCKTFAVFQAVYFLPFEIRQKISSQRLWL